MSLQSANKENIILKIYLPSSGYVKVRAGEKTSVEQIIEATLKQNELESKDDINQIPLLNNPKACIFSCTLSCLPLDILRFAEEDGAPDEDTPG